MSWIYLVLAGLLEVGWAVGLKYTEGFTRLIPSLFTLLAMLGSVGLLGLALLVARWRREALMLQLLLMAGYTVCISVVLPHYWFDPYAAVAKNLVLMVATLWLFWTEPRR